MSNKPTTDAEKPPVFSDWGIWYIIMVVFNILVIMSLVIYFAQF